MSDRSHGEGTGSDVEEFARRWESIGVALSGGGVRASLFSLGALMFLVDSGLNERVSEISSVSGGSVTNAAIAQRCDFSSVSRDEFDGYAKELAAAIVRGLVPKTPVVAVYGLLTLFVVGVVAASWPMALPWWADLALVGGLGFAALMRGLLLAWLLKRRALRHGNRTLGSLQDRPVNHVFCATDLNSSSLIYLMTRAPHVLSPTWGIPTDKRQGGDLPIATAVRASAAFPGGLPPVRLKTGKLGLLPATAQLIARHVERDFADMERPTPKTMYLSDGGVWNNIGTDWFLRRRRTELVLLPDRRHPQADQFIVIDASAPTVAKARLWYLTFPWLAEVGSILRTLKALSASTVLSRIDTFRSELEWTGKDASGCLALVRLVDRVPTAGEGEDVWPTPGWFQRRAVLYRRLWEDRAGLVTSNRWFWRDCTDLFRVNARVPTTLFGLRPESALGLVLHGYCSTRVALVEAHVVDRTDCPLPTLARCAELVGLPASASDAGWSVGRTRWSKATAVVAPLSRSVDGSLRNTKEVEAANQVATAMIDEVSTHLAYLRELRAQADADREWLKKIRMASKAYRSDDIELACKLYEECDRSGELDASHLLTYATALGKRTPGAGLAVARRAEALAGREQPALLSTFWFGYMLARSYAQNGDAASAVASLGRVKESVDIQGFLRALDEDRNLDEIRTTQVFRTFVDGLRGLGC